MEGGIIMASLNKVELIGHLGSKPELKHLAGQAYIAFRLATNRKFKDKDNILQTETQWHTIRCWGKLAETANKFLSKGQLIYLEGRLEYRNYEDEGGKAHFFADIVARNLIMLADKKNTKETSLEKQEDKILENPPVFTIIDEDIE